MSQTQKEEKQRRKSGACADDVLLGQRIRIIRKFCGLSQEKLGARIGVSFQQLV